MTLYRNSTPLSVSSSAEGLRRAAATASLLAFVASPALRRSPYRAYGLMRRLDPVHRSPLGAWGLTRHADVSAALRNPLLGSDEGKADPAGLRIGVLNRVLSHGRPPEPRGPFLELFRRLLIFRDPPDHTRLRALVAKAFTPRRVEGLAPRVGELVDELLEPALRRGQIELMSELAYPLPLRVICELLGVPAGDEKVLLDNAPALAVGLDPDPMRTPEAVAAADRAAEVLVSYLEDLIRRRRLQPGDDLLSGLIAAEEKGDRLSEEDLVAIVLLLLIAGHETTANLVGNGLVALLRHREALTRLREDADADRPAVDELLRYDGPTQMAERITLEPVEVAGRTIPTGRIVVLAVGAANHDPDVFDNPEHLDLLRSPNPQLGFGGGAHFCVGAPLARLEARIAIPTLVRRLPGLHLTAKRLDWRPSFTIRGLQTLPLSW